MQFFFLEWDCVVEQKVKSWVKILILTYFNLFVFLRILSSHDMNTTCIWRRMYVIFIPSERTPAGVAVPLNALFLVRFSINVRNNNIMQKVSV